MKKAAKVYDVCVVGSGAAGGIVAMELSKRGASVALLEAGKWIDPAQDFMGHVMPYEFPHRGRRREYHEKFRVSPGREPFTWAGNVRSDHFLVKAVGGKSLLWAGLSWRISPHDLKAWPISYQDLAPYYDRVERLMGVCGAVDRHPNVPDGVYLKPLRWHCAAHLIKQGCERLDGDRYRVISVRKAILTERNWSKRPPCHYCGDCMKGCDTDSKYTSANTAVPLAIQTGRCKLITFANVSRVTVNKAGNRATGVRYFDARTMKEHEVRARMVVLACGPIETARLLLLSRSEHYPNGLANSSGLVGKNLMSHNHVGSWGLLKLLKGAEVINDDGTEASHAAIASFYWEKPHPEFPGGYYINIISGTSSGIGNLRFAQNMPGFGSEFKREMRETYPGLVLLDALNAMIPSPERYVELDPGVKDVYGLPVPKIHFSQTTEDVAMIRDAADRSAEIIEASGGKVLWKARSGGHDSTHYVGTCKMGTDPKTSVLTPYCRAHDVENLYVADGSCFVDYPEKNPTLTVMAIAARCADSVYDQLKLQQEREST
jgi:choline dehydrogenase-like flavoprotein